MKPVSRRSVLASALALIPASWSLRLSAQGLPRDGKEFTTLNPPQANSSNDKVDVLEFFWYGCPHCYAFQAAVLEWEKSKAPDVLFKRVPVAFSPDREPHSRLYYALEALGLVDKLHQQVFYAIHKDRNPLLKPDDIAAFMEKQGVNRKQWLDTYNSFGVVSRAQAARKLIDTYRIQGTPELAIGGRYRTAPSLTNGADGAINTVNYLVAQVRKSQGRA